MCDTTMTELSVMNRKDLFSVEVPLTLQAKQEQELLIYGNLKPLLRRKEEIGETPIFKSLKIASTEIF